MRDFWYKEFDASADLPAGWQRAIFEVAEQDAKFKVLVASSVTSRELTTHVRIPVFTVGGRVVQSRLPWLLDLYRGRFRDIAQTLTSEVVSVAADLRYAVNLNVQRGTDMRYECHVDSNPIEGLLYVTDHPPGKGGELVVAKDTRARGEEAIARDATRIYPKAGKLVFFDARAHPHFVAPLTGPLDERVVVAMNFYVPSCPESSRPADLNSHLGIE